MRGESTPPKDHDVEERTFDPAVNLESDEWVHRTFAEGRRTSVRPRRTDRSEEYMERRMKTTAPQSGLQIDVLTESHGGVDQLKRLTFLLLQGVLEHAHLGLLLNRSRGTPLAFLSPGGLNLGSLLGGGREQRLLGRNAPYGLCHVESLLGKTRTCWTSSRPLTSVFALRDRSSFYYKP